MESQHILRILLFLSIVYKEFTKVWIYHIVAFSLRAYSFLTRIKKQQGGMIYDA